MLYDITEFTSQTVKLFIIVMQMDLGVTIHLKLSASGPTSGMFWDGAGQIGGPSQQQDWE